MSDQSKREALKLQVEQHHGLPSINGAPMSLHLTGRQVGSLLQAVNEHVEQVQGMKIDLVREIDLYPRNAATCRTLLDHFDRIEADLRDVQERLADHLLPTPSSARGSG